MRTKYQFSILVGLLSVASLCFVSNAFAGGDEKDENKESAPTKEKAEDGAAPSKEERRKSVRMPFFTAALDGGLVFFSDYAVSATDENGDTQKLNVSHRAGVLLKLQLNLLGDGLGIEINPIFASEWTGESAGIEQLGAIGAQLGVAYRFHVRRVYPKIGIGGHLAYLWGDNLNYGIEAYGRLPVGFSWYFVRVLALDFEVAWMSGATGLKTSGMGIFDDHARYDYTNGLEVVIGLRFP